MMTDLRATLTSRLDPVFFGMTCLLMAYVLFTAKLMADEVATVEEGPLRGSFYSAIPPHHPWVPRGK